MPERSKQRRTKNLVHGSSLDELAFATETSLPKFGKRSSASTLNEMVNTTPTREQKHKKAFREIGSKKMIKQSGDESLSLIIIIKAKLSKHQYLLLRIQAKHHNVYICPCLA